MIRKHFVALACALHSCRPSVEDRGVNIQYYIQWKDACQAIALVCRHFNNTFDTNKFLKACGVE